MSKNIIIAIDGPAGSGKSTIAKMVAERLDILYLDSGAFYRAVTLAFLRSNILPPFSEIEVKQKLAAIEINLTSENSSVKVLLNGEDVSEEIRLHEVTASVSEVSENGLVRMIVTEKLQELAQAKSVVMDGRDIGTAVFPHADLKIFMTATPEERARRRYLEMKNKGIESDINEITKLIVKRDKIDSSREIAPLTQAEDAILLDTTEMSIEEVVDFITKEYNKNLK